MKIDYMGVAKLIDDDMKKDLLEGKTYPEIAGKFSVMLKSLVSKNREELRLEIIAQFRENYCPECDGLVIGKICNCKQSEVV